MGKERQKRVDKEVHMALKRWKQRYIEAETEDKQMRLRRGGLSRRPARCVMTEYKIKPPVPGIAFLSASVCVCVCAHFFHHPSFSVSLPLLLSPTAPLLPQRAVPTFFLPLSKRLHFITSYSVMPFFFFIASTFRSSALLIKIEKFTLSAVNGKS